MKELKKNSFLGEIWAVHPTKKTIGGVKCYRTTFDLPSSPDAVFVGVNREKTVSIIEELSVIDAGGVVCFASGFSETSVDDNQTRVRHYRITLLKQLGKCPY